jgi:DNA-binding XRE family transcriptional regulator
MPPKGPKALSAKGYTPGKQMKPERARFLTPFARWLKVMRLRSYYHGDIITQGVLAEITGISLPAIQKMERGDQHPEYEQLYILSEFFRTDVNELFLKTYNLPPDMQMFLCTTVEGAKVVKNIRKIMTQIEQQGGSHRQPDFPDHIAENGLGYRKDNRHVNERVTFFAALDVEQAQEQLARTGTIDDRGVARDIQLNRDGTPYTGGKRRKTQARGKRPGAGSRTNGEPGGPVDPETISQ